MTMQRSTVGRRANDTAPRKWSRARLVLMCALCPRTTALQTAAFPQMMTQLDAPHVHTLPVPAAALARAHDIFEDALMPLLVDGLIERLNQQLVPCVELDTRQGKFFVMRGGSSTNEALRDSSDLAWISVNDEATFAKYEQIFDDTGVADVLEPLIDSERCVRLYSCFYVVRSRCSDPNYHTDWPDAVGNNAFTLLTPIEDYKTEDFQLLYKDKAGSSLQYRYRTGEAICFSSRFVHSTEPGRSAAESNGRPHVFLCFTFGSDKEEHWPVIAPTINGYQSRFLHRCDGESELTEIGKYLQEETRVRVQ